VRLLAAFLALFLFTSMAVVPLVAGDDCPTVEVDGGGDDCTTPCVACACCGAIRAVITPEPDFTLAPSSQTLIRASVTPRRSDGAPRAILHVPKA